MAAKIKAGDEVIVLTGKDRGKRAVVRSFSPKQNKVVVEGVAMIKRHQKPTQTDPGGIKEREAAINVSNVALVDPSDSKACRVKFQIKEDGSKVRVSHRTGTAIPERDWRS